MEKQTKAPKKPRQKRIEPIVTVTIIWGKREDDPARYERYQAWMAKIIRKALARPDQADTFKAECAPVESESKHKRRIRKAQNN